MKGSAYLVYSIKKLKNLYLYNYNKLIFNDKDNDDNYVIFNLSKEKTDLEDLIKNELFYPRLITGYYVNRYIDSDLIRGTKIRVDRRKYYQYLKKNFQYIKTTKRNLDSYEDINYFYDLSPNINGFFQRVMYEKKRKVNMFEDYLHQVLDENKVPHRDNAYCIVPVNEYYDYSDRSNLTHPLSFIYQWVNTRNLLNRRFENITFVLYNSREKLWMKFKIDGEVNRARFNTQLEKFMNNIKQDNETEKTQEVEKQTEDEEGKERIKDEIARRISDLFDINSNNEHFMKVRQLVDEEVPEGEQEVDEDEIIENLKDNEEFKKYIEKVNEKRISNNQQKVLDKRKDELSDKQAKIKMDSGKTIEEILENFQAKKIDKENIEADVINEDLKQSTMKDFDRNYMEKQFEQDQAAILTGFNDDKEFPVYLESFEKDDTSDEFNKKETYTIKFSDVNGQTHTVSVDVPIVENGQFFYINGGKKFIKKQIFPKPITKINPDEVQMVSNYSKMFMNRFGTNVSENMTKLRKQLVDNVEEIKNYNRITVEKGNALRNNEDYNNPLEYDDLSQYMISIKIGDNYIFFDRSKVIEKIENKQKVDYTKALDKVEDDKDLIVLGYNDEDKELLVMNKKEFNVFSTYLNGNKKNDIGSNLYSTITNLISEFDEDIDAKVNSKNAGNRFVYSRVRTGNVKVPTILLLGFYEGLENVLDRYDIDYEFTEDKKNLPPKEDSKYNMVEFADGYLYYSNEPFRNSMLLNGLYEPPTKEVEFDKLNEKTIYLDFFQDLYGSRLKGKTFNNIMDLFIDPITEDVLEDLDQPTDIVGVLLYANELLTNNAYKDKNSMENYRLRGAEQVNAILYKSMADAFRKYKDARRGGNTDVNISVKKDEVVKSILDQPNVNEYSILNPFIEVQSMGASSYSGPSGQNLSSKC
jgi:hypothetical protein